MTPDLIRAAATRLDGFARRTPLLSSPFLDEIAGRRVLVKAECLQHTGSFKYRGARAALSALSGADRARGVFAMSSGNHAQGVALAARELGITAVILMPSDAPTIKIARTRALGAEVVLYDRETEDRDVLGQAMAQDRNLTLIHPYNNPQVIAGQGTVGLELTEQARAVGVTDAEVLVCCGGGGLTSGIAVALSDVAPGWAVHPVEPLGFDDVAHSLRSGRIEHNARTTGNICDAILTPAPGKVTFPLLAAHCAPGLAVSEDACLKAMSQAMAHLKLVLEPGGAVALAAALYHPDAIAADTVIVTASGGNADPALLERALAKM